MVKTDSFREEIEKLIEETKKFLDDLKYYDVSSSAYLQIYISQKIHQLEGMILQLDAYEKDPTKADIGNMYQVFGDIRSDIYCSSKKWRLQVEYKYKVLKARLGKLYYLSSLGA